MNLKRFTARTSREALALVQVMTFGEGRCGDVDQALPGRGGSAGHGA